MIEPLAANRYLIKFTASAEMLARLRQAQDLLRHAVPSGDAAQIFDRALIALVEDLTKKKFAATEEPRARRGTSEASRDVPASVKRAVWMRDDGQCSFAGHGGRRCEERGFLESPPEPVRRGWRGVGREHRAPVPRAQPVRIRAFLCANPRRHECASLNPPRGGLKVCLGVVARRGAVR